MSSKRCCVPQCAEIEDSPKTLHLFPNPKKDIARFRTWVHAIGGEILSLNNENIYKVCRVCQAHFEEKYVYGKNRISRIAVPSLLMPGLVSKHTISASGTTLITPQTSCDTQTDGQLASIAGPSFTCMQEPSPQHGELLDTDISLELDRSDPQYERPPSPNNSQASVQVEEIQAEEIQVEMEEEIDVKAPYKICRICLATNRRLYHLSEHCRDKMLEEVTGISALSEDNRLPQYICWECSARMLQAHTFMNKAHFTDVLLHKLLHKGIEGDHISIVDIQSINRMKKGLESCLTTCVIEEVCDENSQYRLQIRDLKNEDEIKQEILDNDTQGTTEDHLEEDLGEEAEPIEYLEELPEDVQEDCNELITLDDIEKVVKELQSNVEEKERKKVKRKIDDVQDPIKRQNKYTFKNRKNLSLDLERVFTITQLSYEQQIEEVNKRRESESYMSAPYKCDICYRGYKHLHAYNTHKAYHSDILGIHECLICKRRFKTAVSLRRHLFSSHTGQYDCKLCDFTTRYRDVAVKHRAWHAGQTYICEQCGKQFQGRTTYMTHVKLEHVSDFKIVEGIKNPDGFTIGRHGDLSRHVRACLVIPDPCNLLENKGLIGRCLSSQNDRIQLSRWLLVKALKHDQKWFTLVDIPEEQVKAILEADRELGFLTGSIYVRFQANGKYSETPPGWDPVTQSIRWEQTTQFMDPEVMEPEDAQAVAEGFTGFGLEKLTLEGVNSNDVVALIPPS